MPCSIIRNLKRFVIRKMEEIKNLKKAAARILEAINKKEKIILYGDADLDGITSVIILKETLKNLNGQITAIYFPDREKEGYGITETGLNNLKKFSPALLIVFDLGIGNFKEVKLAQKMGLNVIIIDHHQILDKLPEAEIIVNPKQKGDKYDFKKLATVGLAFKLSEELLEKRMTDCLRKSFLELTAIATLADLMPRESENETMIQEGLSSLENSWRPGIKVFFDLLDWQNFDNIEQKVSKIISILNIRDVENNLPAGYRLLTASNFNETKKIFDKLLIKTEQRKIRVREITAEAEERIFQKEEPIIFEGDSNWEVALIPSLSSFFCQKYQKPTFIFKKLEKESQGTVRTPTGIDSVALMKKCKKYLLTFGGHAKASGFRTKNENLEKFKECLVKNLCEK